MKHSLLLRFAIGLLALLPLTLYANHTTRHSVVSTVHQLQGTNGQCSAVMVAPGRAFTAAHCLHITDMVLIIEGKPYEVVSSYAVENTSDVAVIMAPGAPCPCAPVAGAIAKEGDKVMTVGYPYGSAKVVTYGEVQTTDLINEADSKRYTLTTCATAPGFSGGGVFDSQGRLLGINSASDARGILSLYGEVLSVYLSPKA